jgi:hypothetical protein
MYVFIMLINELMYVFIVLINCGYVGFGFKLN